VSWCPRKGGVWISCCFHGRGLRENSRLYMSRDRVRRMGVVLDHHVSTPQYSDWNADAAELQRNLGDAKVFYREATQSGGIPVK
jgi:hypothetical protein